MSDAKSFQKLKDKGLSLKKILKKLEIIEGDTIRINYGEGKSFQAIYVGIKVPSDMMNCISLSYDFKKGDGFFKHKQYYLYIEEAHDEETSYLYRTDLEEVNNIEKIRSLP